MKQLRDIETEVHAREPSRESELQALKESAIQHEARRSQRTRDDRRDAGLYNADEVRRQARASLGKQAMEAEEQGKADDVRRLKELSKLRGGERLIARAAYTTATQTEGLDESAALFRAVMAVRRHRAGR